MYKQLILISALLAVLGTNCRDTDYQCEETSVGVVSFHLKEGSNKPGLISISGTFLGSGLPNEAGQQAYEFEDSTGSRHTLLASTPGATLLLKVGRLYRVDLDIHPGMPTTSGLLVWEGEELVFAGASDYTPGQSVLKGGIPGIQVSRVLVEGPDLSDDPCLENEHAALLRFSNGPDQIELCAGNTDSLGVYLVHCLTARQVAYSSTCSDAGVIEISYMMLGGGQTGP